MPFITEEIYQQLYNIDESIMISEFPKYSFKFDFKDEESKIEKLKEIIVGIRNIRANLNVHPSKKADLTFVTKTNKDLIEKSQNFLKKL